MSFRSFLTMNRTLSLKSIDDKCFILKEYPKFTNAPSSNSGQQNSNTALNRFGFWLVNARLLYEGKQGPTTSDEDFPTSSFFRASILWKSRDYLPVLKYIFVFILANKKLSWDTETLTSQASWLFKIRALNEILEWSNLIKKLAAVWAKLSYDALRGLGKVK